jgi:hypothetical protein
MNRWKAAGVHLSISIVLASSVAALLYFLWFPLPYFIAAGANRLFVVLMGVDICLGPALTLLVVTPNKSRKLLKLDLSIIAALQIIAFAYGIHVLAAARPVFIVAAIDRLVLVPADALTDADLAEGSQPEFRNRSWTGPVLVGAQLPKNSAVMKIAEQALSTGKDIDRLPKFYLPYDSVIDKVLHHAKTLSQLKNATSPQRIQLEKLGAVAGSGTLLTLPLQRGDYDYTAIISPKTKQPILILPIDPW